ncbi:MAG: hypothetical protein ABIO70_21670 [Pseudomonadota bacterium]
MLPALQLQRTDLASDRQPVMEAVTWRASSTKVPSMWAWCTEKPNPKPPRLLKLMVMSLFAELKSSPCTVLFRVMGEWLRSL